jgi:predicted DNA-binding transcriptional regulator YafY
MDARRNHNSGEELRRVSFIRLITRWLGKPMAADIEEAFGLSPAQAYRVLKAAHGNASIKVETEDACLMLDFLRAQSLSDRLHVGIGLKFGIGVDDVDAQMLHPLSNIIVEKILESFHNKKSLTIAYMGRKGASDRLVSPTQLVHVLNRYHIRAWDHGKRGFRDFLLSRVIEAVIAKERYTAPLDKDWEESIALTFSINPDLPLSLRASLAAEWDMKDDRVRNVQCRKAHARYVVRRLTERTTIGQRRWLPENEAARQIFNLIENDVER